MRTLPATAALLLLAGLAAAQEKTEPPAATYHGRPVSRAAVYEAIGREFLRGPDAEKRLEQFLIEAAAAREQAKRRVVVAEEEVAAAIDVARRQTAEKMARGGQKVADADALDRFLQSAGVTLEEFRAETRKYLAYQKMAREDLAATGEVPRAQLDLWLRDLLRRWKATADPAKLPAGAVALLGEEPLRVEQAGRWRARTLRREDLVGSVVDVAFGVAVEERAAKEGVSLAEEEVAAEVFRRRRAFLREPGVEGTGITFESWLRETQGMGVEELRRDPGFRARLLARKVLGPTITDAAVEAEWKGKPDRWGESARIRRLLVRGEDRVSAFGASARPMAEARAIADRALEEIRGGKSFEVVAKKFSEDVPPNGPRGQPLRVAPHQANALVPQPVLDEVFAAKEGALLGPIKAADGWSLVLVEKRVPAPTLEEAREPVRDALLGEAVRKWLLALRADPGLVVATDL